MTIRSSLRALLGMTAVLTVAAAAWPDSLALGEFVDAAPTKGSSVHGAQTAPTPDRYAVPVSPSQLPRPVLELADFDPFGGVHPPLTPPPKPVAPAPLVAAVAVAPVAPALNYRYLGQMTDPSGERRVYLAKGDIAVAVGVGMRLDEGYVVEAIDVPAIQLRYPPLDAQARIPIPPTEANRP